MISYLAALAAVVSSPATPPAWVVDQAHSRLGYTVSVIGQPIRGEFKRWSAQIAFDPDAPELAHVDVTVDTGSAATGDKIRDQALPTSDWFATKLFPRARFASDTISRSSGGSYLAQGRLTLRDVSRPMTLPFTLKLSGSKAVMIATVDLDRRQFHIGQGQFAETSVVGGKVTVDIVVIAKRSANQAPSKPPQHNPTRSVSGEGIAEPPSVRR